MIANGIRTSAPETSRRNPYSGPLTQILQTQLRQLAAEEDGFVSLMSLIAMLGILLGITAVANIALVTRDKLESQNAADAVIKAASTHMSRGMNAIAAANHSIGELQAVVVLHHAYGGDNLERGGGDITPGRLQQGLRSAFQAAYSISPGSYKPVRSQYNDLSKDVRSEAALGDAFLRLKRLARTTYWSHAVGGSLYWWWYTRPAGIAIMVAAKYFIRLLHREWKILKDAEAIAESASMRYKKRMRDKYIPALYEYTLAQQKVTPQRMEKAATEVGEHHFVEGSLFPGHRINRSQPPLRLPIQKEPRDITSQRLWRSQLVQASTPWIQYWRQPVLSQSQWTLPLSRFASYYHKHTQEMSLSLAERARKQQGILLLVMNDHTIHRGFKGNEDWTKTEGSRRADELFSVVGFTQRTPPSIIGKGIYLDGVKDRLVTFAQSMIYNANPVERPGNHDWQAVTGWDTLNWVGGQTPQWKYGSSFGAATSFRHHPKIRLNWQNLLVPSTRIAEAVRWQQGPLGRVLERTETQLPVARTH